MPKLFLSVLAGLLACSAALTKHSQHRMSTSMSKVHRMHRGDDSTDVALDVDTTGAACLDGSPFYFTYYPGTSSHWTIQFHSVSVGCYGFEGKPTDGGESGSDTNCADRAEKATGSSSEEHDGSTSSNCQCRNYDDAGSNASCHCVSLLNCDGSMLGGYIEDPIENEGQFYYSRGRRNLNATIELLLEEYGLNDASDVVLYGQSGAGAAVTVAVDAARELIPETAAVRGLSVGGFVPEWEDAKEDYKYIDEMKRMYEFHGMEDQLSKDCTSAHADEPWLCMLAPHAVKHLKTPMFFMNSHYDAWQLIKIDDLERQDIYENMSGIGKDHEEVERYGAEWLSQFEESVTSDTKHGAYITSCMCHCGCGPNATDFIDWDEPKLSYIQWYTNPTYTVYVDPDEANYDCNNGELP